MIDIKATGSTHTAFNLAIALVGMGAGAIVLDGMPKYAQPIGAYEWQRVLSSYSSFKNHLNSRGEVERFSEQISAIYSKFSHRQERLGVEFEAAIFNDIDNLYEA